MRDGTARRLFCQQTNSQIAAFVAALLSFFAQLLACLMVDSANFFFCIITFSLCCHAMLFYGIRKEKLSFIFPYLVCQIVCTAYILGEIFFFGSVLTTTDPQRIGCFYPDPQLTGVSSCNKYVWTSFDEWTAYDNDRTPATAPPGVTVTDTKPGCHKCYPQFKSYATLVLVSLIAVLVAFVLTWYIVLRYTIDLRRKQIREREGMPRVSYFNHGINLADLENLPRPPNSPPIYTEKAEQMSAATLASTAPTGATLMENPPLYVVPPESRDERTESLPPSYVPNTNGHTDIMN